MLLMSQMTIVVNRELVLNGLGTGDRRPGKNCSRKNEPAPVSRPPSPVE